MLAFVLVHPGICLCQKVIQVVQTVGVPDTAKGHLYAVFLLIRAKELDSLFQFFLGNALTYHQELVASDPELRIIFKYPFQTVAGPDQQLISRLMAHGVIDALKTVYIPVYNADGVIRRKLLHAGTESMPVLAAGQLVIIA
jgi:hypothetical protein